VIATQAAVLQSERAAIDLLTRRLTASVLLIEALGGGGEGLPQGAIASVWR
jgi:outer membrane protein TolC